MEIPEQVGVMILPNATLFPHGMLPLYIFEPRYRTMLAETLRDTRMFAVALRRPGSGDDADVPSDVAGLGLVRASVGNPDGTSNLILQGVARVRLTESVGGTPYPRYRVSPCDVTDSNPLRSRALMERILDVVAERLDDEGIQVAGGAGSDVSSESALKVIQGQLEQLKLSDDPGQASDVLAGLVIHDPLHRQQILETADINRRLGLLLRFLDLDGGVEEGE